MRGFTVRHAWATTEYVQRQLSYCFYKFGLAIYTYILLHKVIRLNRIFDTNHNHPYVLRALLNHPSNIYTHAAGIASTLYVSHRARGLAPHYVGYSRVWLDSIWLVDTQRAYMSHRWEHTRKHTYGAHDIITGDVRGVYHTGRPDTHRTTIYTQRPSIRAQYFTVLTIRRVLCAGASPHTVYICVVCVWWTTGVGKYREYYWNLNYTPRDYIPWRMMDDDHVLLNCRKDRQMIHNSNDAIMLSAYMYICSGNT